ncbi:hypothetical protein HU200_006053 [Digitaria exilis]|uniref:Cd(2+)-exporting ATPase n=1 Tax=Digitaria exilis TaxID=1010633 RepID=A0A835FPN9_9POAL|nr:hypothetical protein HU200_006053 [Digitaria exilis]
MGDAPPPPPPPGGTTKSYFDVLGICCPSEVPLVERLLSPLPGVTKVTVIVPSRTVIVVHDAQATSPAQIVKVLNQAKLDASVRAYGSGTEKKTNKWPSPYVLLCGACLVVSLFAHFWRPLKWFALGAVAAGVLPILQRSYAAARRLTLDVNILMLIAVSGAIALKDYSEAGFIVFLFTTAEWLETRASHKDVKVNTVIAVKAGEIIPIDGVVVDGRSEVDESTLTGESFPVAKQPESQVWAGTLNIDGYIAVRTTAMADNSAVAKMARLVEEAQNSRSDTQRLIDTCAKYYTPVGPCPSSECLPMCSSAVDADCHLLCSTDGCKDRAPDQRRDVLESLAKIKIAAFDKTGTITRGEFCVEEFQAVGGRVPIQQLLYCSGHERHERSHSWICRLQNGIDWSITLSDSCRTGSAEAIKELRSMGIKSVMLTGDSAAAAAYAQGQFAPVFCQLGNILDEVHSELLPEDKVRIVDELKEKHGPTLMIGDGMNDAHSIG